MKNLRFFNHKNLKLNEQNFYKMKKLPILLVFAVLILTAIASAHTTVHYFYGIGCPHCAGVEESGILESLHEKDENISVIKHEIYYNETDRAAFLEFAEKLSLSSYERGVPMAVIECNGNLSYLLGDSPIIENLEQAALKCESFEIINGVSPSSPTEEKITLGSIIIGAIVDSINPCAFSVLIFLLVTLLSIGSRSRMIKAAFFYILAVYITYFLAGIGIFQAIQSLTKVTHYVYLASGIIVLAAGLIQVKSFFFPKGYFLKIPESTKPTIEKIAHKGTLPAVILLGFLVSLFELPCTGGIYLAILTLMSASKSFAISYLLLYNFIFILPLIVISVLVYKGTSPELVEKWRLSEKDWMKLVAGIVMLLLGVYILIF